jgi:hypothetical protein
MVAAARVMPPPNAALAATPRRAVESGAHKSNHPPHRRGVVQAATAESEACEGDHLPEGPSPGDTERQRPPCHFDVQQAHQGVQQQARAPHRARHGRDPASSPLAALLGRDIDRFVPDLDPELASESEHIEMRGGLADNAFVIPPPPGWRRSREDRRRRRRRG